MHEYGTTLEQWAQVAVSTRKWAALNPKAKNREPITVKDVLDSRPVIWPFNVLNICLVTDAGGAVVLTRADRAKDCAKKPIYVRGAGEGAEHVSLTQMRNLTFSEATRISGEKAFAMAGVGPRDFNHVMLYDAFTSGPPLMLEALGLAKRGEGVSFFEEGRSTPGGSLPINTNGGGLSYTHSGMYGIFPIIESVRQLRGECGPRQVPNAQAGAGQRHGRDAVGGGHAGARERDARPRHAGRRPRRRTVDAATAPCAARRWRFVLLSRERCRRHGAAASEPRQPYGLQRGRSTTALEDVAALHRLATLTERDAGRRLPSAILLAVTVSWAPPAIVAVSSLALAERDGRCSGPSSPTSSIIGADLAGGLGRRNARRSCDTRRSSSC